VRLFVRREPQALHWEPLNGHLLGVEDDHQPQALRAHLFENLPVLICDGLHRVRLKHLPQALRLEPMRDELEQVKDGQMLIANAQVAFRDLLQPQRLQFT
jgi:hypothetical protein